MSDRILNFALTLTVTSLIAAVAGGALLLGYAGLAQLLRASFAGGAADLVVAATLCLASGQLLRNRSDLLDRP